MIPVGQAVDGITRAAISLKDIEELI